jgi:hypothetical protein
MKNKLDLKAKIKDLFNDLNVAGRIVRFIRCDNAGEKAELTKGYLK